MTDGASLRPEDGSGGELCTSCGLCCSGVLHDRAKLEDDEVERARALGLPVVAGEPFFTLPCPKLVDRRCGIFFERPAVCPSYRCQLLRNRDDGQIDTPSALTLVAEAHRLLGAATAALGGKSLSLARRQARDVPLTELMALPETDRESALAERLNLVALEVFIDRHFRKASEGPAYVDADAGNSGEMDMEKTGEGERET